MKFKRKIILIILITFMSLFLLANNKDVYYILFDNTKSETAANADWVIDDNQPVPDPADPTSESDWIGGISTWGYSLYATGNYIVRTLTSDYGITYNDSSNPYDLSNFDVFVLCEPNNQFSSSEKDAIIQFVYNGGGLFVIADHSGSDRDNDGWDSPHALNDLFDNNGYASNIFGVEYELNSVSGDYSNIASNPDSDGSEILNGDFGSVNTISYHAGSSMSIDTSENSNARALIWENGVSQDSTTSIVAAYSKYGNGRIFFLGDSSPADDGTGHTGDNLQDGWSENDDGTLILNATKWLAEASGSGGDLPPSITDISQNPDFPQTTDNVTISADVTDDNGLSSVKLYYSIDGGSYNSVDMTESKTFQGTIPSQPDGTRIDYYIEATDTAGHITTSGTYGYFSGTTPISKIRENNDNGNNLFKGYHVKVQGYVTVSTGTFNSTSNDVYVEDYSSGINVWQHNSQLPGVNVGDEVIVEGIINQYNGKTEIDISNSPSNMQVISSSNTVYPTIIPTCNDIDELHEGMLVEIRDVQITNGSFPAANSNSWNIKIEDKYGNIGYMAVDKDTNIDGTPTPTGKFNLIGVVYQYDNASPYNSGYKILPRSLDDIEENPADIPNIVINEYCIHPENSCDTNEDGYINHKDDQFIEIVNYEKNTYHLTGWKLYVNSTEIYEIPENVYINEKESLTIFGGGSPMGSYGDYAVELLAEPDGLNLPDSGTIVLKDNNGNFVCGINYSVDPSYSGSYTRYPEITGLFKKHVDVSPGYCSSAGKRANGNYFMTYGDLNYDGELTLVDLMIYMNYFTGNIDLTSPLIKTSDHAIDINDDGIDDINDAIYLANILAGNILNDNQNHF